jgi:hypothetical protein
MCLPIYIPELSHCPLLLLTYRGLDSRKIQVPLQHFFDVCDKCFPLVIQLDGIMWWINIFAVDGGMSQALHGAR